MDFNMNQNLWDLSLPPQLPTIDDSDFLTLLSKQLNGQNTNTAAIHPPPALVSLQGVSPPVSEDSSPSPPANNPRGLTASAPADREPKGDEMHKRKVDDINSDDDDDDIEGQPHQKAQKEQPGKKGSTKRKSTGGDETRLIKRKEQNRAAQRAFRERKEKHVKDLEDKVAQLEQKFTQQATENENLRDLLGRLQNENLMLKQSAFTFSFPKGNNPAKSPTASSHTESSPSSSSNTKSTGSSPLSSNDSPATGPLNLATSGASGNAFTPLLSFPSLSNAGPSPAPSSASSLPLTSLFSPPPNVPVPSPYTTIISNPMYTSYMDASNWDQIMFGNEDLQLADAVGLDVDMLNSSSNLHSHSPTLGGTTNNSGSGATAINTVASNTGSGAMEDLFHSTGNYTEMNPFSAFVNGANSASNSPATLIHAASVSPVARNSYPAPSRRQSSSSMQPTGTTPASLGTFRSSSPCGGAGPDEAPRAGSAHHNPMLSTMSINTSSILGHNNCPNSVGDVEKIISATPLSTFGPPPGAPAPKPQEKPQDPQQLELSQVWQKIKAHPQFEECDMDQLCAELAAKVHCNGGKGSKPVINAKEKDDGKCIDAVVQAIVEEKKRKADSQKQDKEAMETPTASTPPSSGPKDGSAMQSTPSTTTSTSSTSPSSNLDFPMFNPFLPMSYQQNGIFQIPGMTSSSGTDANKGSTSINDFATLGASYGTSLADPSPGGLTANGSTTSTGFDLPMDLPSPGSFASLMNMGPFSPSAYLAFDE